MKVSKVLNLNLPKEVEHVTSASFSPRSHNLVVSFNNEIFEYDSMTGYVFSHFYVESEVHHVRHSKTSSHVIIVLKTGKILIYDENSSSLQHSYDVLKKKRKFNIISNVIISPTTSHLYYTFLKSNKVIELNYLLNERKQVAFSNSASKLSLRSSKAFISTFGMFVGDVNVLASCSDDGIIRFWNLQTNDLLFEFSLKKFEKLTSQKKKKKYRSKKSAKRKSHNLTSNEMDVISCCTFVNSSSQTTAVKNNRRLLKVEKKMMFITGTKRGSINVWNITHFEKNETKFESLGITAQKGNLSFDMRLVGRISVKPHLLTRIFVLPNFPFLTTINVKGEVNFLKTNTIINFINTSKLPKFTIPIEGSNSVKRFHIPFIKDFSLSINKKFTRYMLPFMLNVSINPSNAQFFFYGKLIRYGLSDVANFYELVDCNNVDANYPLVSVNYCTKFNIFQKEKKNEKEEGISHKIIESSNIVHYVDRVSSFPYVQLLSYDISLKKINKMEIIHVPKDINELKYYRLIRGKFSFDDKRLLLFFQSDEMEDMKFRNGKGIHYWLLFEMSSGKVKGRTVVVGNENGGAVDGCFLNNSNAYVLLSSTSRDVSFHHLDSAKMDVRVAIKRGHIRRVFAFSTDKKDYLFYYDDKYNILCTGTLKINEKNEIDFEDEFFLQPNFEKHFKFKRGEMVVKIYPQFWYKFLCVHTTKRICILDINTFKIKEEYVNEKIISCIWVENILLFNTNKSLSILYVTGDVESGCKSTAIEIATLGQNNCVLVDVFFDRIVYCSERNSKTYILTRYLNVFDLFIKSFVLASDNEKKSVNVMKRFLSKIGTSNVSADTLLLLHSHGYVDLALLLFQQNPNLQSDWKLHFTMLVSNLKFQDAFVLLNRSLVYEFGEKIWGDGIFLTNESREVVDEKKITQISYISKKSKFYRCYKSLGKIACDFGDAEIAYKCFKFIDDKWSLFVLFRVTNNIKAIEVMCKRFANSSRIDEHTIHLACLSLLGKKVTILKENDIDDDFWNSIVINNEFKLKTKDANKLYFESEKKGDNDLEYFTIREIDSELGTKDNKMDILKISNIDSWMGIIPSKFEEISIDGLLSIGDSVPSDAIKKDDFLDKTDTMSDVGSDYSAKSNEITSVTSGGGSGGGIEFEVDKDGMRIVKNREEMLKKYRGNGGDSDDDDEEFEEDEGLKKRRKLLRGIKIKALEKKEEEGEKEKENDGEMEDKKESDLSNSFASTLRTKKRATRSRRKKRKKETSDTSESEKSEKFSIGKIHAKKSRKGRKKRRRSNVTLTNVNKAEMIKSFISMIDKQKFKDAFLLNTKLISYFAKDNTEILKKTTYMACVNYRIFLRILHQIQKMKRSNGDIKIMAYLTFHLTSLKIKFSHQIICKNMCIKYNMAAKNFGVSAKIINEVIGISPENVKLKYEKDLETCKENEFNNLNDEIIGKESIRLCLESFKRFDVEKDKHLRCSFCKNLFLIVEEKMVVEKRKCTYCGYGELEVNVVK